MALTLTAVPGAGGNAAVLTVTGAAAGAPTLTRIDANGVQAVRLAAVDVAAISAGGAWTTTDWEVSLVGPARYLLLDAAGAQAIATTTMPGAPGTSRPQLRRTFRPTTGGAVQYVTGASAARELRRSEHEPLGRPDVVVVSFGLGLRAGTLTVRSNSLAAAHAVEATYGPGEVVLLRQVDHPGLDMHHIATRVATDPQPRNSDGTRWWDTAVTYLEVAPAAGDTLGPWTTADLLATYATAAQASFPYATLADLTAGRVGV